MSKQIKPPEAFRDEGLFQSGIGNVALFRFKNSGVHATIFLVDVYCLGVKDVFSTVVTPGDYPQPFLQKVFRSGAVPMSPGGARCLVEGAVAYAAKWGLHPHADFKSARNLFNEIEAETDGEKFEFGHQGKPLFMAGPNETPQRINLIMRQLQTHCGEGNYHYLMPMSEDTDGF